MVRQLPLGLACHLLVNRLAEYQFVDLSRILRCLLELFREMLETKVSQYIGRVLIKDDDER